MDAPHIAEKMHAELEGISLWAFAGLHRLVVNNIAFSENELSMVNRESIKLSSNVFDFMDSDGDMKM